MVRQEQHQQPQHIKEIKMRNLKKILPYLGYICLIFIWVNAIWARYAAYSLNVGLICDAFFVSLLLSLFIIYIMIKKKEYYYSKKKDFLIMITFGSPLSLLIFIYLCDLITGSFFLIQW
jgi:hypothetical protein